MKAIEKDPETRYPSAEELGEDLGRFLADEPIRARRATLTEQTVRWCRRNPAVASLVAAVLLATLTGAGFASFYAVRAENERGKAVDREREAIRRAKDAETASVRASIARQGRRGIGRGGAETTDASLRLLRRPIPGRPRHPRGPPLVPPGVGAGPCRPARRRRSSDADRRGSRRDAGPDRGVFPQDEGLRRRLLAGRTARPHPDGRERGLPVGLRAEPARRPGPVARRPGAAHRLQSRREVGRHGIGRWHRVRLGFGHRGQAIHPETRRPADLGRVPPGRQADSRPPPRTGRCGCGPPSTESRSPGGCPSTR